MKKLSAVLKIFLVSTLLLVVMGGSVHAATSGDYTYSVSNGEATITEVSTSISGDIEIPSTLGGYPVTSIGEAAFERCSGLTSITIPDSVTAISSSAFYRCTGLTSITIPDSVISIGEQAFYTCNSLTSITIPDSVISIGELAFFNCIKLRSITIPDSVTYIGAATFDNTGYYNDAFNWQNGVLYIGNHLIHSKNLSGIYSITPGTKTIASYAFSGNSELTSIIIPDSVICIGEWAFEGCYSLTDISIPNSITSIREYTFASCYGLTSITIPDSVTSIGYSTFYNCTSLTNVTIPDSVTSIGNSAFNGCSGLQEITLPFIGSSRTANSSADAVFGYIFGYETTSMQGTTQQYYLSSSSGYYHIPSSLKKVTITDAEIIPYGAFYNCNFIADITINADVNIIYPQSFYYCENLLDLTLPAQSPKIASANIFEGCEMLTIHGIQDSKVNAYADRYLIDFAIIQESADATLDAAARAIEGNIVVTVTTDLSVLSKFMPIALYDENNKLLDVILVPTNEEFNMLKVVFKDDVHADHAKVILCDSYADLTPLTNAKKIYIER